VSSPLPEPSTPAAEAGTIRDEAQLRAVLGMPTDLVRAKVRDRLDHLTRQFVERSPFLLLATSAEDGSCDVSPRGDPPGFVRILDERTLLLPERPGNPSRTRCGTSSRTTGSGCCS
jgi:predicted pyridoxine 5'-phosphate oxidase superfamily flavin-nucleotide-binding protein